MLQFKPDRFGHCCCLEQRHEAALLASKTPVELCLTSNVVTRSVPSYAAHHFAAFARAGHPVALCTDDSGVFATSLSREYAIAAATFGCDKKTLVDLAAASIRCAFVSDEAKALLLARLDKFAAAVGAVGA
jgi:adenosine deaminase